MKKMHSSLITACLNKSSKLLYIKLCLNVIDCTFTTKVSDDFQLLTHGGVLFEEKKPNKIYSLLSGLRLQYVVDRISSKNTTNFIYPSKNVRGKKNVKNCCCKEPRRENKFIKDGRLAFLKML